MTCSEHAECLAESCVDGHYTPASRCEQGVCTTPPSSSCSFGQCGAGGCQVPSLSFEASEGSVVHGDISVEGALQYLDACPEGSFMNGVNAVVAQDCVGQLGVVCGTPVVDDEQGVTVVSPSAELDLRGDEGGELVERRCPENEVVVAFSGRSGLLLDSLELECAPPALEGGVLVRGASHELLPVGGEGGGAFATISCPGDGWPTGAVIHTDSFVIGVGLLCHTVTVDWSPPPAARVPTAK